MSNDLREFFRPAVDAVRNIERRNPAPNPDETGWYYIPVGSFNEQYHVEFEHGPTATLNLGALGSINIKEPQ